MFQGQDQLPMTASPRTPEALPMMGGGSNIMGGGNKLNNDFLSRLFGFYGGRQPQPTLKF